MHPRAHALRSRAGLPHWPSSHGPPFLRACAPRTRAGPPESPPSVHALTNSGPSDVAGPRLTTAHTRERAALTLRPSPSGHPRARYPANPCSPVRMHCARALAIPLRPSSSTVTRAGSPAEPSQSTCANAHRPSDVAGLSATTLQFRLSQRPAPSHRATPPQSDHGLQTFTRPRTDDTLAAPSALGDRCFHSPTTPHTCPPTRCWHSPLPHLPKRAVKYPSSPLAPCAPTTPSCVHRHRSACWHPLLPQPHLA